MIRIHIPQRDEVAPDTPLRLSVAAALTSSDGSMTAWDLHQLASVDTRDAVRSGRQAK
jgi:hypothetical protein